MPDTQYDAHSSAQDNEPTFTFQGRDPYTASLVNLWATLMAGDLSMLESAFHRIRNRLNSEINLGNNFGNVQMERGKHTEAYHFAMTVREGEEITHTKNDYDAHKTAESGEHTFTLQSKDPYFCDFIELWAGLITGNKNENEMRFNQLDKTFREQSISAHQFGITQRKKGKITMAFQLSDRIRKENLLAVS